MLDFAYGRASLFVSTTVPSLAVVAVHQLAGELAQLEKLSLTGWGQFSTVSTTVSLRAGSNMIRLAKGSPSLTTATGYAELDAIQLQQA